MNKHFIKENVLDELGGELETAKFFNCTRQAIYLWKPKKEIPLKRQLQLAQRLPDRFPYPVVPDQ